MNKPIITCLVLASMTGCSQEAPVEVVVEAPVVNYTDKLYKYYTPEESAIHLLLMCNYYYQKDGKDSYYAQYSPKFLVSVKEMASKSKIDWAGIDKNKQLTQLRRGVFVEWGDVCSSVVEKMDYEYDNPRG